MKRRSMEDIGRLLRAAAAAGDPAAGATPRPAPRATAHATARPAPAVDGAPGMPRPTPAVDAADGAPRQAASGAAQAAAGAEPALDAAQRAAVEHAAGPARVLAAAGSGKTKTLIARVIELVDRGVDPSAILLLAFNREAAEQLAERLAARGVASTRRLGSPHGVHCATFNAFGYRYQREVLGARVVLDQGGRSLRSLMATAVEVSGTSLAELRPRRGSDPIGAFMGALTRVRAALEPLDSITVAVECLGPAPIVNVPFAPVHTQYLRAQATTGLQSFDDQIYFAVADLLASPARRDLLQRTFSHVLVDEFQDLNGAQHALVDVLSRPRRRLFVVGDDDQLIYGWRHADPRGILEFHRRMPIEPWSATYTLTTNYRCSRAVVESGARLVANNRVREPKTMVARPGAHNGSLEFVAAAAWADRAAAICSFLRDQQARLGCAWGDLAVLCRYRSQQLLVALALDAAGLPRTTILGGRLFTHPAARQLRAHLRLTLQPKALTVADLRRILGRPDGGLSAAALTALDLRPTCATVTNPGSRWPDSGAERLPSARQRPDDDPAVESAWAAGRPTPWQRLRAAADRERAAARRPLTDLLATADRLRAELGPLATGRRRSAQTGGHGPAGPTPGNTPARHNRTSAELVWAVVEAFALDDLWAMQADAAAPRWSGPSAPTAASVSLPAAAASTVDPDGGGPLEVIDSLLLLCEVYADPAEYLAAWDRLCADEARCRPDDARPRRAAAPLLDVARDSPGSAVPVSRRAAADGHGDADDGDRVVIGTIHAAKGREYHAVVIPDYDRDLTSCSASEIEEERRVVYVGVTRAKHAVLFTLPGPEGFVHPFLRELVEAPEPDEHESLREWRAQESCAGLRRLITTRLAEIEALYPELVRASPEPP